MKTLTKCIFDMDGLLIDTEKGMWFNSEARALDDLGYPHTIDFFVSLMGTSSKDCEIIMYKKYGDEFPFDEYLKLVDKYNIEQIEANSIKPMPGAIELLSFLKERNVKCVIGTGTKIDRTMQLLKSTDLLKYIDEIVTRDDVEKGKPNPDIFLKCLGNTDKDEALVFEDSRSGSLAAINAGIKLVIVPDVAKFSEQEKQKAFKVIYNLKDAIPFIIEML